MLLPSPLSSSSGQTMLPSHCDSSCTEPCVSSIYTTVGHSAGFSAAPFFLLHLLHLVWFVSICTLGIFKSIFFISFSSLISFQIWLFPAPWWNKCFITAWLVITPWLLVQILPDHFSLFYPILPDPFLPFHYLFHNLFRLLSHTCSKPTVSKTHQHTHPMLVGTLQMLREDNSVRLF